MSSNRLILIFLGFIFVIVIILTSNKITASLRQRFGNILPTPKVTTEEITPTPIEEAITLTPTPTFFSGSSSTPSNEIPATGPNDFMWFILGISLITGLTLRNIKTKAIED